MKAVRAFVCLLAMSAVTEAHHGSAISYDTTNLWSTWATVVEFHYLNPHPTLVFERKTKDGKAEKLRAVSRLRKSWSKLVLNSPSVCSVSPSMVRTLARTWARPRSIAGRTT